MVYILYIFTLFLTERLPHQQTRPKVITLFRNESWNTNKTFCLCPRHRLFSGSTIFAGLSYIDSLYYHPTFANNSSCSSQCCPHLGAINSCRRNGAAGPACTQPPRRHTFNWLSRKRTKRERHLMTSSSRDYVINVCSEDVYRFYNCVGQRNVYPQLHDRSWCTLPHRWDEMCSVSHTYLAQSRTCRRQNQFKMLSSSV